MLQCIEKKFLVVQHFINNAYLNDLGNSLPELIELFILQYTLAIIRPQSFFHVLSRINIFHIYSDKINWYMDVISSKIRKALLSCYQSREVDNREMYEYEYNGSAKVALVAIQISIMAWEALKKHCSLPVIKNIMHVQVVLEQLQRDVEN